MFMLADLTPIERQWLKEGMSEDLIVAMRSDPSMMRFALFHLEGVNLDGPPDHGERAFRSDAGIFPGERPWGTPRLPSGSGPRPPMGYPYP